MRSTAILMTLALSWGCATSDEPDLKAIYDREAQHHGPDRNPVVLLPGMMGSKLVDEGTGRTAWGSFAAEFANPERPDGARIVTIPMKEGVPLRELRDGVVASQALDTFRVRILGIPVDVSAYGHTLGVLGIAGYRDELSGVDYGDDHFTCFQFPYDWRRDCVESARGLHEFLVRTRAYVLDEQRKRYGRADSNLKFDVVAHSMGGLVLRWYLRYGAADLPEDGSEPEITWAGCDLVERAILVGTPNAGSAESVLNLVNGREFGPTLPGYDSAVLGTFPALYQLLPRARHRAALEGGKPLDVLDPLLWERKRWGLADPGNAETLEWLLPEFESAADRRRIALDHQRKCLVRARRFHQALDRPARPPTGAELFLFAGDAAATLRTVEVTGRTANRGDTAPGDGTVLRTSAVMDEREDRRWEPRVRSPIAWRQVVFLFTDHLGLTRSDEFTDNVLYVLLEASR